MVYELSIPANTTAVVILPSISAQITESGKVLQATCGVMSIQEKENGTVVEIGSGSYRFLCMD